MPARILAILVVFSPLLAPACQIPVFRYALERWIADNYELALFHNGSLSEEHLQLLEEGILHCNLNPVPIDVSKPDDPSLQVYGTAEVAPGQVVARLFFPPEARMKEPIWEGEFTGENLAKIVDSPVRQKFLKAVLSGESSVWILLESGEAAKDDALEKELRAHLDVAEEELEIPEGVAGRNELERVASGEVAMEDVLRSAIPLKIAFDIIRMPRGDPAEEVFEKILLAMSVRSAEGLEAEAVLFPVFGRGRILDGLPASKMEAELISLASTYICGACSCEVKRGNPGADLLLTADWSEVLEGSEMVIDKTLPPLEGAGALVIGTVPPAALGEAEKPAEPESDKKQPAKFGSPLLTNMMWVCGVLLVALMGVTIFMKRSSVR